jgi:hypothetical protein
LPVTVAVPAVVPSDAHEVGAEDRGPNTLSVIVPVGEAPPESVADTDEAATAVPAVPVDGALNDSPGLATVEPTNPLPT